VRYIIDPEPGIRELIIGATLGLTGLLSVFSPLAYPDFEGPLATFP